MTLAGTGAVGFQDGPAATASFTLLGGMRVDPHDGAGDLLYFTDKDKIRALAMGPNPTVLTIVGQEPGGDQDGSGGETRFSEPYDLTVAPDLSGAGGATTLFVADTLNGLIRRVDIGNPAAIVTGATPSAIVTTVGGQPPHAGLVDGPGTSADFSTPSTALLNLPQGITTDGHVAYVADSGNNAIRQIDLTTHAVTTVAGGHEGYLDGPAAQAAFFHPAGVTLDAARNVLYIADTEQSMIRRLDLGTMTVSTIAGANQAGLTDGVGAAARFNHPWGLAVTHDGSRLYVADVGNNAIRAIDLTSDTVTTLAGGDHGAGSRDGIGTAAQFYDPTGLALSPDEMTLYITDFNNHLIRRLDLASLAVTTMAGKVNICGHQDGIGTAATLCTPALLATDGHSLFWGDSLTGLLRVMNLATNQVTTVAGAPGVLRMKDGDLTEVSGGLQGPVQFNEPFGMAMAPDGSFLLIADQHANVVRILQ